MPSGAPGACPADSSLLGIVWILTAFQGKYRDHDQLGELIVL
jgi:hypothetical protein